MQRADPGPVDFNLCLFYTHRKLSVSSELVLTKVTGAPDICTEPHPQVVKIK